MAIDDIRSFLQILDHEGELHHITAEVDWDQEIAAITDRISKRDDGGPGLVFHQVKGYPIPVGTNLFGSFRRMQLAMGGHDADMLGKQLAAAIRSELGSTSFQKLKVFLEREDFRPLLVEKPPCQAHIFDKGPTVEKYVPALKTWPDDGGRYLTLPLVITRDPESGEHNYGLYRVQIKRNNQLAIHWAPSSDGARHHELYRQRLQKTPVAIALGGAPALMYAACAPVPKGCDEAAFAAFLRGEPVPMATSLIHGLRVPAGADFVLEGYVDRDETVTEGPFGNHTGFYDIPQRAALFRVHTLTGREDPVYTCTVVGPPPMEDCYMAKFTERLFLPLIQMDYPWIEDIYQPMEGIFHQCTFMSIKKNGPGEGAERIRQLWSGSWWPRARLLAVFDEGTNLSEGSGLLWRLMNSVNPGTDILVNGDQVGIDATSKVAGEPGFESDRNPIKESAAIQQLLARRWGDYGL